MNIKLIGNRTGAALAALVSLLTSATEAPAILFQNIPPVAAGDQYVFILAAFADRTLHTPLAPGATAGATTPAGVPAGVAALDALVAAQAVGAHTIGAYGDQKEDCWGIGIVTQIYRASDPLNPVWVGGSGPGTDQQQLTIMFYGEQDFFLKQMAAGASGTQLVNGRGLRMDLYLQDAGNASFTNFNQNAPGLRPADTAGFTQANDASFPTVTDSNGSTFTAGIPVLQMLSTPGFIHPDGVQGGLAAEYEFTFTGDALGGYGYGVTYLNVVGGTLGGAYNTNAFVSPFLAGATADVSVQFDASTIGAGPNWLVSIHDPMRMGGPLSSPPFLASVSRNASGQPVITWPAWPGRNYRVDYTDELVPLNWQTLATVTGTETYTDLTAPLPSSRFYRVTSTP